MDDLKLSNLSQYRCTEGYSNYMGVNVTDGVAYVMNNGYHWFVSDTVIMARMTPKIRAEAFLVFKLKVKDKKAIVTIEDGNNNILYTKKYAYTNAEVNELIIYYTDNVLLLPGEY